MINDLFTILFREEVKCEEQSKDEKSKVRFRPLVIFISLKKASFDY